VNPKPCTLHHEPLSKSGGRKESIMQPGQHAFGRPKSGFQVSNPSWMDEMIWPSVPRLAFMPQPWTWPSYWFCVLEREITLIVQVKNRKKTILEAIFKAHLYLSKIYGRICLSNGLFCYLP